jgi:hypothetical protein
MVIFNSFLYVYQRGTYSPWFYHRNHCRFQEEAQPQIGHVAGIIRQFGDLRNIIKRYLEI